MARDFEFTPTQTRIMEMMSDGLRHSKEDLIQCLPDPDTETASPNLYNHLYNLRVRLRGQGMDVLCVVFDHKFHYQLVRLIRPPAPLDDE